MSPAGGASDPLIVTAALDEASARIFGDLRRQHFPAARNIVPAHLTLFHHLSGDRLAAVLADLQAVRPDGGPAPFTTGALRFLGRGVAVDIVCPALVDVQAKLAARWSAVLTPQDRQGFRPHVTIQNKVTPAEAHALHARLLAGFAPVEGHVVGLDLWHYRGGPWEHTGRCEWGAPAIQVNAACQS